MSDAVQIIVSIIVSIITLGFGPVWWAINRIEKTVERGIDEHKEILNKIHNLEILLASHLGIDPERLK